MTAAATSDDAGPFDYRNEFGRLTLTLPLLATVDLERIEAVLRDVDTLGPILDPTAWQRGQRNIDEQREILRAAAPLIRLAKRYLAEGKFPGTQVIGG